MSAYRLVTDGQLAAMIAAANVKPPIAFQQQWVPPIENMVETYLNRTLIYEEGIVEYMSPSDDMWVLLDKRPVAAVTEVRYDAQGGFGQLDNTFGSGTILTPGKDYYLKIDGAGQTAGKSDSGTLFRIGRSWGSTRKWKQGLLGASKEDQIGTVKVTYNGGYVLDEDPFVNEVPAVVAAAICQMLCVWYVTLTNVGVVSSESTTGYSYSQILGFDLGDNQFTSVRKLLRSLQSKRIGYGR